jgi:hypothetical protein
MDWMPFEREEGKEVWLATKVRMLHPPLESDIAPE